MMNQPYEDGGIAGPRQKGLIDALQGMGGGLAPDEATAMAHRNQPGNPFASIIGGMGPQAGPTLQGPPVMPGANDFPGGEPTQAAAQSPSSAYSKPAPGGWDQTKWADPNHKSAKYEMRRALDPFTAQQGLTPEALAALNALGYGNFSGAGQKLSLSGLTDKGRQAGLGGDYKDADFVTSFQGGANPDAKWGYADPYAEAQQAQSQPQQGGGGMTSQMGMGNISGMLHGDAQANIQQALGALQQPGMLQQLIAALQGGQ